MPLRLGFRRELVAGFLGDARRVGTSIRERLFVVGERRVRFFLQASGRVEITLDPIPAFVQHVADARQRDPAHDEQQGDKRQSQPKELAREVLGVELRKSAPLVLRGSLGRLGGGRKKHDGAGEHR